MSQSDTLRVGVATASLGMAPIHNLDVKLAALSQAGFEVCEIGFGDYMSWVRLHHPDLPASTCPPEWGESDEPDPDDDEIWKTMYDDAPKLVSAARQLGLHIMALQPLNQFEGWPKDSQRATWCRRKAERWLLLCSLLGVDMIQVGANNLVEANATDAQAAADLHWLAELGARQEPPVKIAYEVWCFGSRANTWERAWELVQLGDHPNLGLCLDVAHFPLAPTYGWDPSSGKGWLRDDYEQMLERLRQVPKAKIFYVEVSDVLEPVIPLGKGSSFDEWRAKNKPARGDRFTWTICGRPLPFVGRNAGRELKSKDDLGNGRVIESLQAILDTGYRSYIMLEFFEAILMEQNDPTIPEIYSHACVKARQEILKRLK